MSEIFEKYTVIENETGEKVENFFILRPDKDNAAVVALRAYAEATENEELAADIISWIGSNESGAHICGMETKQMHDLLDIERTRREDLQTKLDAMSIDFNRVYRENERLRAAVSMAELIFGGRDRLGDER